MAARGRFRLFEYLADAVCGLRQNEIFTEDPHTFGFELVQRLAAVAPQKLIVPVKAGWDDTNQHGYLVMKLAGRRCRLDFTDDRYAFGLPDREALARFLEDANRLLHERGIGYRVRVEAVDRREADMVIEPTGTGAQGTLRALPTRDEILPPARVLVVDVESVDDPSDYVRLLAQLAERCPKGLAYDGASCVRDDRRRVLTVVRGRRKHTFELDARGSIDPRFLAAVVSLLADARSPYRLIELSSDDQCLNLAFVTRAEEKVLGSAFLLAPR
jgi:hypothetical protein